MNSLRAFRALGFTFVWILAIAPLAKGQAVYEPFDYAAGASLSGLAATGLNLSGSYATSSLQDLVIGSPGLTYGSLQGNFPSVTGNMLSDENLVGPGVVTVDVDQDVLIGPGQQIFFSALFRFDDTGNGVQRASVHFIDGDTGDELSFGEPAAGVRVIRVEANTAAAGGTIAAAADNQFINGQTLLLIGRYVNSAAPDGDVLEIVGYDTAKAVAVSPTFNLSDPNADYVASLRGVEINFAKISSLRFEVRGSNNNFVDELRISHPIQVPEPRGLVMLVGGVGLALVFGWRARSQYGGA